MITKSIRERKPYYGLTGKKASLVPLCRMVRGLLRARLPPLGRITLYYIGKQKSRVQTPYNIINPILFTVHINHKKCSQRAYSPVGCEKIVVQGG